jgi:hypothetical protein
MKFILLRISLGFYKSCLFVQQSTIQILKKSWFVTLDPGHLTVQNQSLPEKQTSSFALKSFSNQRIFYCGVTLEKAH